MTTRSDIRGEPRSPADRVLLPSSLAPERGTLLISTIAGIESRALARWHREEPQATVLDVDPTNAASASTLLDELRTGDWSIVMMTAPGHPEPEITAVSEERTTASLLLFDEAVSTAAACGVDRFITLSSSAAADPTSPAGAAAHISERLTVGCAANSRRCLLSVRIETDPIATMTLINHAVVSGKAGEVLAARTDFDDVGVPAAGVDEIFTPTDNEAVWRTLVPALRGQIVRTALASSLREGIELVLPPPPASSIDVPLAPPVVGERERERVLEALDSGWVAPAGPALELFEERLSGWVDDRPVLALSAGSAALHLALLVLGVGQGDDVVVQTSTFAATAFAVRHAGANPVFCDVDAATGNLDPELLAELLDERARSGRLPAAVVPVDLYGLCADYRELRAVCEPYGIPIVQDAAESLGSRAQGSAAGSHGDLAVLSFNGNKIVTTSGGGALVGPDHHLREARKLATQSREPGLHYEHANVGYNYRLSNLLAAVGSAQLDSLADRIERREQVHERYRAALAELEWMPTGVTDIWNGWLSVAFLPPSLPPHFVCRHLAAVGIEARPFWKPMHRQPVFRTAEAWVNGRSDAFYAHGLCLPSGYGLSDGEQERVIELVAELVTRYG